MCIIIYSPKGEISESALGESLRNNPDGWGFAVACGSKLYVRKGMHAKHFRKEWKKAQETFPGLPVVFHARITTHGKTNIQNCHPFPVGDGWTMVHNGMIEGLGDKTQSDTAELAGIIRRIGPASFLSPEGRKWLEVTIGYSKLVFLSASGQVVFVNYKYGYLESDGNWYSNTSWKKHIPVVAAKAVSHSATMAAPSAIPNPMKRPYEWASACSTKGSKGKGPKPKATTPRFGTQLVMPSTKKDDNGKLWCNRGSDVDDMHDVDFNYKYA